MADAQNWLWWTKWGIARVEDSLKEKSGSIKVHNHAPGATVKGDRLHLINMINNLIDNAIKYCSRVPEIAINIRKVSLKKSTAVSITISDNGIGVSPENQKRIFQQFFRVPTGNIHNVKGFGIGLHYVKLIAEAHHGNISLKSQPGVGSEFILTLPLA